MSEEKPTQQENLTKKQRLTKERFHKILKPGCFGDTNRVLGQCVRVRFVANKEGHLDPSFEPNDCPFFKECLLTCNRTMLWRVKAKRQRDREQTL